MARGEDEIKLIEATAANELPAAVAIFREYAASLPFSLCFQGFDEEMSSLPGKYAPPAGTILLAKLGDDVVGCGAVRPISAMSGDLTPVCEMKRMYVKPSARGLGIGRLIAVALIDHAASAGFRLMKLDSESDFVAAVSLYRSLGFVATDRYNDDPHPHTVWMAKVL